MKKSYLTIASAILLSSLTVSCNKEDSARMPAGEPSLAPIVLGAAGEGIQASVTTKATEVTSLDSFHASAVTGSAGSEVSVWNDVVFTKDGESTDYLGGKYWPTSDPEYKIYGSSLEMTFNAAGTTVAATNDMDVICAYAGSSTYKTKNTLTFEHIFARLTDVTVAAASGYTLSDISISITPRTGGTYNIRTGAGVTDGSAGWPAVDSQTVGSATGIANATAGTKSNDIYLIPGTYTLTASWTAERSGYEETISGKTVDVALVAGKKNKLTVTLGGNASEIVFGVTLSPWEDNDIDNIVFPTE